MKDASQDPEYHNSLDVILLILNSGSLEPVEVQYFTDLYKTIKEKTKPNFAHATWLIEQMTLDGYVKKETKEHAETHQNEEFVVLTNKGRLFIDSGGYRRLDIERKKRTRAYNAIRAARIAETIMLILIALFTAWLQFDDWEKDERIIQTERRNTVLDSTVADMRRELRFLQSQRDTIAAPPSKQ